MKKLTGILICLLMICVCAFALASDVFIDSNNFPCYGFRNWLLNNTTYSTLGNSPYYTEAQLAEIKKIDLENCIYYIDDLTGINHFTSLQTLVCNGCRSLEKLDLSGCSSLQQLVAFSCGLSSVNLNGCTNLTHVNLSDNQLTSFDPSSCHKLNYLNIGGNELSSLDISKNTLLTKLECVENKLSSLDISNIPGLKKVLRDGTWSHTYNNNQYYFLDEDDQLNVDGGVTILSNRVTFNANGGSGAMTALATADGKEFALTANAFTRDGWKFTGWNTRADGSGNAYDDKASVTLTKEDLDLFAQWEKIQQPNPSPEDPQTPTSPEDPQTPSSPEEPQTPSSPEDPQTPSSSEDSQTPSSPEEQPSDETPPSIKLSKTKLTIKDAKPKTITAKLGNRDDFIVSVKYSKEEIAEAETGGKKIIITPKKAGKTTITFTTAKGVTAKIKVTVKKSQSLNKKSITLKKGETFEIKAYAVPSKVKVKKYKSDNPKIARVSKKGIVKAKKKGKTTITVILSNGKELELKVKVK